MLSFKTWPFIIQDLRSFFIIPFIINNNYINDIATRTEIKDVSSFIDSGSET